MAPRLQSWRWVRSLLGRSTRRRKRRRVRFARRAWFGGYPELLEDRRVLAVTLAADVVSIGESGEAATVTAQLSEVNKLDVWVDVAVSGVASPGSDYTLPASQIFIPAGRLTGTFTITSLDDTLHEGDESIFVVATGASNEVIVGLQRVQIQLIDNDAAPAILFTANDGQISENGGVARMTAALSAVSGLPVIIDLRFAGTAIAGIDFLSESRLVIPAGSLLGTLSVAAVQDSMHETSEPVEARITAVTNGSVAATHQLVTTILDDDPLPTINLIADTGTFSETDGLASVKAELSNTSYQEILVGLTYGGNATFGVDYVADELIRIAPGASAGTAVVRALPDTEVEGAEFVLVAIVSATNAGNIVPQETILTLLDDDESPAVTLIQDTERMFESAGSVMITATLDSVTSLEVTVVLDFSGTAMRSVDFEASSGEITIPAGQSSGSVALTAIQDSIGEAIETIIVDVIDVRNGREPNPQQLTVNILDDDSMPLLQLAIDTASLGEARESATVIALLSTPTGRDVIATLGFSGTATNGGDYLVSDSQLVLPAGSSSASVTLITRQDDIDEQDEELVIEVVDVVNAVVSPTAGRVTTIIVDDDLPPVLTVLLDRTSLFEDHRVATVTARLSVPSSRVVSAELLFGGTATTGIDYSASGENFVFPPGSVRQTVLVLTSQDSLDEPDESIEIRVGDLQNATLENQSSLVATIKDDDDAPVVTLASDNVLIPEAAGSVNLAISISAPSAFDVEVELGYTGTAIPEVDYSTEATRVVIPAGATQATASIVALEDQLFELSETVIVDILSANHAIELGIQRATAVIRDNDKAPEVHIEIDNAALVEGEDTVVLTAALSTLSGQDVLVSFAFSGGATFGADYDTQPESASTAELLISAGQHQATIELQATPDAVVELTETVIIEVVSVTKGRIAEMCQFVELVIADSNSLVGAISGQAFHDLDSSGGQDAGEPSLDGLVVQLIDVNGRVVASQLTGARDLNQDGQVEPVIEQGWYSFRAFPGNYTVRQIPQPGWRITSPIDPFSQEAFEIDQQLDFVTTGEFWEDWGGKGEKWLQTRNDPEHWYYISTGGEVWRWDGLSGTSSGTELTGTRIASLTPEFHEDPMLLVDAEPLEPAFRVDLQAGSQRAGADFGQLKLASVRGQQFQDTNSNAVRDDGEIGLNGWLIELVDQHGEVVASRVTADWDVNADGQIDATERGWYSFDGFEPGTYSIRAVQQAGWQQTAPVDLIAQVAWVLDQQFDFFTTGNLWENFAGEQEKWLQAADNADRWYFLTPTGQLLEWDGTSGPQTSTRLSGTLVATLGEQYYADPTLLIAASAEIGLYRLTVVAGEELVGLDFGSVIVLPSP